MVDERKRDEIGGPCKEEKKRNKKAKQVMLQLVRNFLSREVLQLERSMYTLWICSNDSILLLIVYKLRKKVATDSIKPF